MCSSAAVNDKHVGLRYNGSFIAAQLVQWKRVCWWKIKRQRSISPLHFPDTRTKCPSIGNLWLLKCNHVPLLPSFPIHKQNDFSKVLHTLAYCLCLFGLWFSLALSLSFHCGSYPFFDVHFYLSLQLCLRCRKLNCGRGIGLSATVKLVVFTEIDLIYSHVFSCWR